MDAVAEDARPALLGLVHLLRQAGVAVSTGQVVACTEAIAGFAPIDLVDLYWIGRVTLVSHPGDLPVYDRVYRAVFHAGRVDDLLADEPASEQEVRVTAPAVENGGGDRGDDEADATGAVASDVEILRHRRFDRASPEELRAMQRLMAQIPLSVPDRRTRRTEAVRHGRMPDMRRSLRHAIRTDGEIIRRAWKRRRTRPRRLVLVLDVSGSMTGFARALLQFAFSATRQPGAVEVFCFGTRLTHITTHLAGRDPDAALAAAAERVVDWEGGTLIGASLGELNRIYGRRGLLRGAVVVICSDGLERGDPEVLRTEMARVRRYAHRVVWVNPLKRNPEFEPVQRGMRAALPHVDRLVSGHDLASLDELAAVVSELR